jgi:hypothetical protein
MNQIVKDIISVYNSGEKKPVLYSIKHKNPSCCCAIGAAAFKQKIEIHRESLGISTEEHDRVCNLLAEKYNVERDYVDGIMFGFDSKSLPFNDFNKDYKNGCVDGVLIRNYLEEHNIPLEPF